MAATTTASLGARAAPGRRGRANRLGARRQDRPNRRKHIGKAAQTTWKNLRSPGSGGGAAGDPLDPLAEEALLPGTSDRAFWIGSWWSSLSLISGLATYLILTGLTPIVPRNEVVLERACWSTLLLVIAMVAVIAVQVVGLWRAWKRRWPVRACTCASWRCSA